jgi:hypothetical protein
MDLQRRIDNGAGEFLASIAGFRRILREVYELPFPLGLAFSQLRLNATPPTKSFAAFAPLRP